MTERKLRTRAAKILSALGCHDSELSILLTDGPGMRSINREYRGIDKATDVLSFAMREGPQGDLNSFLLGDVVLSLDMAVKRARRRDVEMLEPLTEVLIHGILHLLGYDHVRDSVGGKRMRAKERELMHLLDMAE